jgi:hypothetical protein
MLSAQTIWYVNGNATGTNSGVSWSNAFTTIQSAVSAANSGDEIWVAYTSTYKLTSSADRGVYLSNSKPLSLFGGFVGTETSRLQRSTSIKTLISGDIGIQGDQSDNSYSAIKNTSSLAIDGFRFSFFNSDFGSATSYGVIVSDTNSVTTIRNCEFDANLGGGKGTCVSAHKNSQTTLISCALYSNNTIGSIVGYRDNARVSIEQCNFQNNGSSSASLSLIYGLQNGMGNSIATDNLISVRSTNFSGNKGGFFYTFFGSAQFDDCDFYAENSLAQAFYHYCPDGNLSIDSSYFSGTFPSQFLYCYTKSLSLTNTTLQNASNINFSFCYFSGQDCTISNCSFNNLRSSTPIYLYSSGMSKIEKTVFNTGNAGSYLMNISAPKLYLTDNTYQMITATLGNYLDIDSMFVSGCTFENLMHIPLPLNNVTFALIDSSVFQQFNISQPLFSTTTKVIIKNTTVKSANQSPANPGAPFVLANWGGGAVVINSKFDQLGTKGDLIANSGKLVIFGSMFSSLTPLKSIIQNSKELKVYNCNFIDLTRPIIFNDTVYSSGDKSIQLELVNSIVYSTNDSLVANKVRPGFYTELISNCITNRATLVGTNVTASSAILYQDFYASNAHPQLTDLGVTIPNLSNYSVLDIDGNNRVNNLIDIGAIEFLGNISSINPSSNSSERILPSPNPSSDLVTIELKENARIEILDMRGQVLETYSLQKGTNSISLMHLASGTYQLRILTERTSEVVSVVKM